MDDTVEVDDVEALKETDEALLLDVNGEELWVPKSAIASESDIQGKGDSGTLVVAKWWAKKNGLD